MCVLDTADGQSRPSFPYSDPHTRIRRVCPGNSFADASLFIWCATMLSVYEFSKAIGPDGKVEEPLVEYTSGVVRYVYAFHDSITANVDR